MSKTPELLAPAGNLQALVAALHSGADAVYLGAAAFGARSNAGFDFQELKEAVRLCHLYQKKVYVTLNTLLKQSELDNFISLVKALDALKVDAAIVQDLGALRLIKKYAPNLSVHASTQMAISTLKGALNTKNLGIDRVVFARETDLQTIKMAEENGIETEVFVHGALCVSVSGLCILSSMRGGRSGNRGRCAQACREQYVYKGKKAAWLSTRDINDFDALDAIKEAGVSSLKIEGRLKRPEYVACVTSAYQKQLNNLLNASEQQQTQNNLLQIFNRGGFSQGHLFGGEDTAIIHPWHVSHEGIPVGRVVKVKKQRDLYLVDVLLSEDINDQDGLEVRGQHRHMMIYSGKPAQKGNIVTLRMYGPCLVGDTIYRLDDAKLLNTLRQSYENKPLLSFDVDAHLSLVPGQKSRLKLFDNTVSFEAEGDLVQSAQKAPITKERAENSIRKSGDLPIKIGNFSWDSPLPAFIPISSLNQLRRMAIEGWLKEKVAAYQRPIAKHSYLTKERTFQQPAFVPLTLQSHDLSLLDLCHQSGIRFLYAPGNYTSNKLEEEVALLRKTDALVLPAKASDTLLDRLEAHIKQYNISCVLASPDQLGLDVPKKITGSGVYLWNNETLKLLYEQNIMEATLPIECTFEEIAAIETDVLPLTMQVYGRTPVMVLNHCPERVMRELSQCRQSCRLCEQRQGTLGHSLIDEQNRAYPLFPYRGLEGCVNLLLSDETIDIGDKANTAHQWLMVHTTESKDEILSVIEKYQNLLQGKNVMPAALGRYDLGVL